MTCGGEGGMVITDDDELAAALRSLVNQGRADAGNWLSRPPGCDCRLDDVSVAIGLGQVERLDAILARPRRGRRPLRRAPGRRRRRDPAGRGDRGRRPLLVRVPVLVDEGVDRDR